MNKKIQEKICEQQKKHIDKITDFIYGSKSWRNNKLNQNKKTLRIKNDTSK